MGAQSAARGPHAALGKDLCGPPGPAEVIITCGPRRDILIPTSLKLGPTFPYGAPVRWKPQRKVPESKLARLLPERSSERTVSQNLDS